jgi:hypothetical protein
MRISRCSFLVAFISVCAAACAGSQPSDLLGDSAANAEPVPDIGVGREARTSTSAPDASIHPAQDPQGVDAGAEEASAKATDEDGSGPDPAAGGGAPTTSACPPTAPPSLDLHGVELCHHPAIECWRNEDCIAGNAGRCTLIRDGKKDCASATACSYDACTKDTDCPNGGTCQCAAGAAGENVCN